MRRKSERNKSKGSPEKKVEKATRKSTRRRGKRATSSSPEREDGEGKSIDVPKAQEVAKESTTGQPTTRLKIKEMKTIVQEELSTKQISSSSSSSIPESAPVLEKIPEGGVVGTGEGASVWKVARADASPGEIQKLKLCRQRNPSEASDSSSSRKKYHKSYESGEGDGDEGDSAEELPRSRKRDLGSEQQDDPSSSNPGQDSKEEVSHCREILPRTTSANFILSDDKKNVDRLADNNADQAIRYDQNCPVQKSPDALIIKQEELSSNGDDRKDNEAKNVKKEVSQDSDEDFKEGRKGEEETVDEKKVKEEEEEVPEKEKEKDTETEKEKKKEKEEEKVKEKVEDEENEKEKGIEKEEEKENENEKEKEDEKEKEKENKNEKEKVKEKEKQKEEEQEKEKEKEKVKEQEAEKTKKKEKVKKEEETKGAKKDIDATEAIIQSEELPTKESQTNDEEVKVELKIEPEPKESSSDEDRYKMQNPEPVSEAKVQPKRSEVRASLRTSRRKHRNRYHESSDSDTPESEDEPSEKKAEESKSQEEQKEAEDTGRSRSPSPENRLSFSNATNTENKIIGPSETEERINNSSDDKLRDETSANARTADYKPAKVNLKRSFSARLAEAEESTKKEDVEKNGESEASLQVKINHAATEESDVKNLPRKRRWGTAYAAESTPAFTVSTDSLKALVPGAKPLSITEVRLSKDDDEEKERRQEREKRHSVGEDTGDQKARDESTVAKNENTKRGDLKHDNHLGTKRKISILKEAPRIKSPSPPSAKATNILLIKNLVRPFTLNQIKELLSRTGTIVENGFWIDGIKSKCYVVYANEDQAFETRQALHGISWPVSNPKRLHVEYASKEDMELARELSKDQPVLRKTEPLLGGDNWQQVWTRDEKQNSAVKVTTVREWDVGKEDGNQVKEKEREKKDLEKKRRQRSRSPPVEPHLPPPARKFKKKEDEPPPAKLLDDLFKKTKAIPCIYWLPLTNEQIVVKEEMRRQHMAEHARRLEEMKRAERSRDPTARRRRSPRK